MKTITKPVLLCLGLLLALQPACVRHAGLFLVTRFGAKPDGKTLNTVAIQHAIDKCSVLGGGRVIVPKGRFLTGTLLLKSGVELYLEQGAVLLGTRDTSKYPFQPRPEYRCLRDEQGFRALIYAEGQHNIAVCGSGTIDGQGGAFPYIRGMEQLRPKNIMFVSCQNVRVRGLNLRSSGSWMQHYLDCEDMVISDLDVFNHVNHNNDMIDIDGCRRVRVLNCRGDTDDDGITLKSTGAAGCEQVVVSNCVVSTHCNAVKMGTESTGGFRDIAISNCVVTPSRADSVISGDRGGRSGLALEIVDGGTLENVTVTNMTIRGTQAPLFIRLGNRGRKHMAEAPKPPVGILRNVTISNIVATDVQTITSSITGIPGHPVENVSLSNVQIYSKGGVDKGQYLDTVPEMIDGYPGVPMFKGQLPASGVYIRHVRGLRISGLTIGAQKPDVRPPVWAEDAGDLKIEGLRVDIPGYHGPSLSGPK